MKDYERAWPRVYDDLEKARFQVVEQARTASGAADDDLLVLAGWPGRPKVNAGRELSTRPAANSACIRAKVQ